MRKPSICGAYASSPCVRVRKECANKFVRVRKEFVRVRNECVNTQEFVRERKECFLCFLYLGGQCPD